MQRNLDQNEAQHNSIIINTQVPKKHQNESFVKLKDSLFLFMGNWKWFVLSLIVAFAGAYYYLRITPNIYRTSASIMIKADDGDSGSKEIFQQLGIKEPSINITNEIMSMKTAAVSAEIVKRLNLNVDFFHSALLTVLTFRYMSPSATSTRPTWPHSTLPLRPTARSAFPT